MSRADTAAIPASTPACAVATVVQVMRDTGRFARDVARTACGLVVLSTPGRASGLTADRTLRMHVRHTALRAQRLSGDEIMVSWLLRSRLDRHPGFLSTAAAG